jgi:hypothetical protein
MVTDLPSPAAREGSQQTLAQVVETLGEVQGRDGARAAYKLAAGNIRASAHFLLHLHRSASRQEGARRDGSCPGGGHQIRECQFGAHAMKEI